MKNLIKIMAVVLFGAFVGNVVGAEPIAPRKAPMFGLGQDCVNGMCVTAQPVTRSVSFGLPRRQLTLTRTRIVPQLETVATQVVQPTEVVYETAVKPIQAVEYVEVSDVCPMCQQPQTTRFERRERRTGLFGRFFQRFRSRRSGNCN